MSVIIKGVDMPKSGESIRFSVKQIIEIPRPHGRLIDADKLLDSFRKAIDEDNHFVNFFSLVESAPTIIEAEVSE
jgi:hypothetical protein